jgi:hypothetical protein
MSARNLTADEMSDRAEWLDGLFANGLPKCSGHWVGGSGGHRTHEPCSNTATYADWSDQYAYCEAHLEPADREAGSPMVAPWAGVVRELEAMRADRSGDFDGAWDLK